MGSGTSRSEEVAGVQQDVDSSASQHALKGAKSHGYLSSERRSDRHSGEDDRLELQPPLRDEESARGHASHLHAPRLDDSDKSSFDLHALKYDEGLVQRIREQIATVRHATTRHAGPGYSTDGGVRAPQPTRTLIGERELDAHLAGFTDTSSLASATLSAHGDDPTRRPGSRGSSSSYSSDDENSTSLSSDTFSRIADLTHPLQLQV
jgi:hypothetical protein